MDSEVTKKDKHVEEPTEASSSSYSTFLALLALVLAAASCVGLFYLWNSNYQSGHQLQSLAPRLDQIQLAQSNLQRNLAEHQKTLSELQENLSVLREQSTRDEDGWVLAEVDYIIRIANFNLDLDRNIALAIKLLKTADDKIRSLGNPSLASLRKAIASSISSLSSIAQVDTEGLVIRLQVLSKKVEALPLAKNAAQASQIKVPESEGVIASNWRETFKNSLQSIKDMVVIRRLDKPTKALLQPDQHANLIENIQLQLSSAQWAVLHHQAKIYQESLRLVKEWVDEYFQRGEDVTAVLNAISEMLDINVAPDVPEINIPVKEYKSTMSSHVVVPAEKPKEPVKAQDAPVLQPKPAGIEVISS